MCDSGLGWESECSAVWVPVDADSTADCGECKSVDWNALELD